MLFRSSAPVTAGESVSGTIETMAPVVLEGNTHYYVVLTGKDLIYDVSVSEFPQIVLYKEGGPITFEYLAGEGLQTVTGIQ